MSVNEQCDTNAKNTINKSRNPYTSECGKKPSDLVLNENNILLDCVMELVNLTPIIVCVRLCLNFFRKWLLQRTVRDELINMKHTWKRNARGINRGD